MSSKKSFIEYVLFHYDFVGEDAVYVLNYLKSQTDFDSRVSLTNVNKNIRISIAEKETNRKSIMLRTGDKVLLSAEEIFNFLEQNKDHIYLEFFFKHLDIKYTELLFTEKNKVATDNHLKRASLLRNIENALLMKDKELFLELTTELKKLDGENLYALYKE